jgi:pheromone shutdown protein TraB
MRRCRTLTVAAAAPVRAAQAPAAVVKPPPAVYDHRISLMPTSLALVERNHPELVDLARAGTLVVVPRAADYVERREDGYLEPELVYLVGTAHLSPQSADDVRRVVEAVRPQNVVVELCKSRTAVLYEPPDGEGGGANLLGLSGGPLLGAFRRSVALGGRSALLLRLLLGGASERLSAQLGVRTGGEFRAAAAAAEAAGAQIVLGDRPVEVTLRRAWDALTWRQRWALGAELAAGARGARGPGAAAAAAAAVERLKSDDAVSAMLASIGERYPLAVSALVHERDLYLAWSLKRSKAVNGTQRVVGVVGRGHLRGVCYALTHDDGSLRFRDLAGSRRGGGKGGGGLAGAAGRLALETAAVSGAWYLWTALHAVPPP